MLNRLQSLFNRLAGISEPAPLFPNACQSKAFSALEKPACWRRRSRKAAVRPS